MPKKIPSRSNTPTSAVRKRSSTSPSTPSTPTTTKDATTKDGNKEKDGEIKTKQPNATLSTSSKSFFSFQCSGGAIILFISLTILMNLGWIFVLNRAITNGSAIIAELSEQVQHYETKLDEATDQLNQFDNDLKEAYNSNQLLESRSSTLQSQLKETNHLNKVLEGRFQALENMVEEGRDLIFALENEKADMVKEKIEYIRQMDMYRIELNKMENKFTECINTLKSADSEAKKNKFDNDLNNLDNGPDDKQDQIYEWFAAFFNYVDPGMDNSSVREKKVSKVICPFANADNALEQFKLNKKWIELQRSSINSDARKQIIKELSLQFHPDKMKQHGCPPNYGDKVMAILNEKRESKRNRKH